VRGAITQLDSNVLQSSASAGVSIPFADLAVNGNQVVSVVSIDLNVGKLTTRQIIPGISASNSIAVVQSGKGADVGGLIGKAGLSLSVSLDKSEGFHQAVRNLIELSTIEVLGKLTRVPYWQCLRIESTNPNFRTEARGWFDTMGETERETFVRSALARTGYLQGQGNAALDDSISRYQAENDLVPNGRIDFDLYYRLLASDAGRTNSKPVVAPTNAAVPVVASAPAAEPPRLVLSSPRGPRPRYRVGETLVLAVQPTADAYVYCYYQDASGSVARIYPNRFQPDPLIVSGRRIEVPPQGVASFAIRLDQPGSGNEAIACFGSDREAGMKLPSQLKAQDLEPLPVKGLDDIAAQFRQIPGARVDDARLPIEVVR
jgi:hypothetical protein